MIHLNDKKEFVIFQKPHSGISYIGIGNGKRKIPLMQFQVRLF